MLQLNLGSHFGFRRRRVVRARVKTTPTNPLHTLWKFLNRPMMTSRPWDPLRGPGRRAGFAVVGHVDVVKSSSGRRLPHTRTPSLRRVHEIFHARAHTGTSARDAHRLGHRTPARDLSHRWGFGVACVERRATRATGRGGATRADAGG